MEEIAEVYARSLYEVAKEHDKVDEIHDQLGELVEALDGDRNLQVFFFSPYFSSEEKKDGIGKVVDGADEHFQRFLELLAERHRMPAIFRIRKQYDALWREEHKLLEVAITSAVELDEDRVKDIGKKIEEQTGRRIELSSQVDEDLLGGLVLRVGNKVLDASVRGRLERIRREVAKAA